MALCKSYDLLTPRERVKIIGEVIHCITNDEDAFKMAELLVRKCTKKGLFNGVIIAPVGGQIQGNLSSLTGFKIKPL